MGDGQDVRSTMGSEEALKRQNISGSSPLLGVGANLPGFPAVDAGLT